MKEQLTLKFQITVLTTNQMTREHKVTEQMKVWPRKRLKRTVTQLLLMLLNVLRQEGKLLFNTTVINAAECTEARREVAV